MNDKKSPIEDYEQSKEAAREKRKKDEIDLWHTWKTQGMQPKHLEPLLKAYEGTLAQKVRGWKAPNVPESAFKLKLQEQLISAFKTFNPDKGAALNTHVEYALQKVKRYNVRNQNLAYIPEGQVSKISPINKAFEELHEDLGREPTNAEIADHLGMTEKRVATIRQGQRKDIASSMMSFDPTTQSSNFEEQQIEVASQILPTLFPDKPQMHTLFNHIYGTNDHEKIQSTSALAKKLKTNDSQISRMKKQLGTTLAKKMGLRLPGSHEEDD